MPLPKGFKHSEETKKKISENSAKFWRGKTFSSEHKQKLKIARRKRVTTEETRGKISKSHKGLKHSVKSKMKMSKNRKGDKNPNWKGGLTPEYLRVRHSIETRLWRESVFARDNWTCQKTGIRGGKLHPHHIKNFAQYPELRFAIDNGITLSGESHREFHRIYGKKNNSEKQLASF